MGQAKRYMEQQEELQNIAIGILVEVGCLDECDHHPGTFTDGGVEVLDAYKLANSRISRGELKLPWGITRADFTDVIKGTYEDYSGLDGCTSCEKLLRD